MILTGVYLLNLQHYHATQWNTTTSILSKPWHAAGQSQCQASHKY